MKQVTTIWFEDEERRTLENASRSVGIGLDGDEREYVERTLRGIAQPGDVISRERLVSSMLAVRAACERVSVEATLDHWKAQASEPGVLSPTEAAMAVALVDARIGQANNLLRSIDVLVTALDLADPKPTLEKWSDT